MLDPRRPLSEGKIAALTLLKQALDASQVARRDRWQLAVRKEALLAAGATANDLRKLVSSRLAEEAIEIIGPAQTEREFRRATQAARQEGACFVLTHGGNVYVERHILVANGNSKVDGAPRRRRASKRRRRSGTVVPPDGRAMNGRPATSDAPRPQWRAIEGELYFRERLVRRRGRKVARLEEFLLGAFQKQNWAQSILIEFAAGPIETPEQLKECVRRLNDHMLLGTLRFHVHSDDAIVSWEDAA